MMMMLAMSLFASVVAAVVTQEEQHSRVLVERTRATPLRAAWSAVGPAARESKLELQFFVRQQNTEDLFDVLEAVSDPRRKETYGQHLSNDEVHALVAPLEEDVAAVEAFLRSYGAEPKSRTPNSDVITATVSIETAEKMLDCSYTQLKHATTGAIIHRVVRGEGYSLPQHVAQAVDMVAPTVHVPPVRAQVALDENEAHRGIIESRATFENKPETLRELYGIGDAVGVPSTNNSIAVTAFLEQYYSAKDLQLYWSEYCDAASLQCGEEPTLPTLVGDATTGTPAGTEAMLDIETVTGVAGNVHAEFWGFSGRSDDNAENEPFLTWLTTIDSTPDATVPKIFSTSYGEDESSWSYDAAKRLNVEFSKAGSRGISLFFSSGDEGANCENGNFYPETPCSSPFVTAVGGTLPVDGYPQPGSETAGPLASGGFSNYWDRPSYQDESGVIDVYLQSDAVPTVEERGYNISGRAVPDISAQAYDFCVAPFGCTIAGTSCSSPTVAAVFALLNDLRLQNGKSTLGFLNPFLYQLDASDNAFFDVDTGASSGCVGSTGWPAIAGWDAVTGLGTPSYPGLATAVLALP